MTFENDPALTLWPASATEMRTASARLAVCSLMNGSASEAQSAAALRDAQSVGVTTLEFLHARLLLGASGAKKL